MARVEEGTEDERSVALVNGERAVAIDVLKVSGANTVEVADGVKEAIGELGSLLPAGVNVQVVRDNSVSIRQSVSDVIHELLIGAVLTVLVVMLFLNDWKATAITALALPVSVISSFILMNALGFTLNVLTLMALSLSIGILIDDAIVVVENIVRHREMGEDHFTAAGREKGEDPYFTHLYRVGLDGSGMKLLNPGDASHSASLSESNRYFVDNSSRVNGSPESILYDTLGTPVTRLETPDLSALMEVGFKYPEPFMVKARDGATCATPGWRRSPSRRAASSG